MEADKMNAKKLKIQQENDEGDSNQCSSSNGLPQLSSNGEKSKEIIEISPVPCNVLDIICEKLKPNFDDVFHFAGVCQEWRAVEKLYWKQFVECQSPLVVQTSSYAKKFLTFYSISEDRAYRSEMGYFWGLSYCGSSSGYLIMAGLNNTLHLMNPFVRKRKVIDFSSIKDDLYYYSCRVLLAFIKGTTDFVIIALCKRSYSLHVFHSRNSTWITYCKRGNACRIVDFVVMKNNIFVVTNKGKIGVLSLNTVSVKLLPLTNTPKLHWDWLKLVNCDGNLLMVRFAPNFGLTIYRIDLGAMNYVKLETLGDMSLFYSSHRCYAVSNPGRWQYDSNCVYYINCISAECNVYSATNNELVRHIVLAEGRQNNRSKCYWLDWCLGNLHDEVVYRRVG